MSKYDLSILIPSRNEEFISNTVADILKNKRGKTEIIVGLDGQWAEPGIPDHPDVRIVYVSESLGQRAITNLLCKLSESKYVAKCDAHTCYDEGFDVKLMTAMEGHDDYTIVPMMLNLHGFDWLCPNGHRRYQGAPGPCTDCGLPTMKDVVFKPRDRTPHSSAFCFDSTMKFQYFNEFKKRPEGQGELTESMSLQGSFFMLTRDKYWELNICDEGHGSWGQQGTEVACKTWLSGGRVVCLQTTWYAHLFRTQDGFGFPYPMSGRDQEKAREYSRKLWLGNNWPLAIHDLQWLIDKFSPVPDWNATKGIIYYTDNQMPVKLAKYVQKQIKDTGLPIVSASLKPMDNMGKNVYLKMKRGPMTMFKQILAALEASTADIIFFCEHDVLYHQSHFDFTPQDRNKFYYNRNWWKVWPDGLVAKWDANQLSGLCCYRERAIDHYTNRVQEMEADGFNRSYEPGGRDKNQYETWDSPFPDIDIRHDNNLTKSHRKPEDAKDQSTVQDWKETTIDQILGWDNLGAIIKT